MYELNNNRILDNLYIMFTETHCIQKRVKTLDIFLISYWVSTVQAEFNQWLLALYTYKSLDTRLNLPSFFFFF